MEYDKTEMSETFLLVLSQEAFLSLVLNEL